MKPRAFQFAQDHDAARLGEKGFSTRFITQHTGLTPSQVAYRLKKAGVHHQAFRNGETVEARRVAGQPASRGLARRLDKLTREIDAFIAKVRREAAWTRSSF